MAHRRLLLRLELAASDFLALAYLQSVLSIVRLVSGALATGWVGPYLAKWFQRHLPECNFPLLIRWIQVREKILLAKFSGISARIITKLAENVQINMF